MRTTVVAPGLTRSLLLWYRRHRRDLPWRGTNNPYRIWISEVMLQQTTVKTVIPYYRKFLARFPTLRSLARAPLDDVLGAWSGLGYYRRARQLHAAARLILETHRGRFPRDPDAVRALPGVGRYTAGAVLSIAFGLKEPVLDGNVARVLSRLFLLRGDPRSGPNAKRLWAIARSLVESTAAPGDLNQALMELGALICAPAAPECTACPVARRCAARAAGVQESIPARRRLRDPVSVHSSVALVERRGRYLMRRRGGSGLMDGLWEFPSLDPMDGRGVRVLSLGRVADLRHSITYRRLRVEVHRARLVSEPRPRDGYRWVTPAQARRLPASSLVRKVLDAACIGGRAVGGRACGGGAV